jgi:hypothetical protein
MIDYKRVLWFDEHHRQVVIGLDGITSEFQTFFARDENGSVETTGKGQYCKGKKKLKMKYTDEARFCFGCCYGKNGEGFICNNFIYMGQTICYIADHAKVKCNEMERVRLLKGGSYWIKDRQEGHIWMDDPVTMTSGVKAAYAAELKAHSIETLGQLAALTDEIMEYIDWHPDPKKRIPLSKLIAVVKNVKAMLSQEEKPTPMISNHTREANPYNKSKFGEEEWEQRLTESSGVHRYCSVMDLAEYMVAEGYRHFLNGNF